MKLIGLVTFFAKKQNQTNYVLYLKGMMTHRACYTCPWVHLYDKDNKFIYECIYARMHVFMKIYTFYLFDKNVFMHIFMRIYAYNGSLSLLHLFMHILMHEHRGMDINPTYTKNGVLRNVYIYIEENKVTYECIYVCIYLWKYIPFICIYIYISMWNCPY